MHLAKLAARLAAAGRSGRAALRSRREALDRPRCVPGAELIGQYPDSGFKEPPYIVRRPDGQIVQLTQLLYLLATEADGTRDLRQLAVAVSRRFGRRLSPDDVAFLVDTKLRPAGLICSRDGAAPHTRRADPLLALRYRAAVVRPAVVRAAARPLRSLFVPVVVGVALSWLVVFDIWLANHGIDTAARQIIARPALLLALLGMVIVSAVWHELGHAAACAYGGAKPGAMGIGLYVIWPAFYTDVTDAYRLRRAGRLRTDLGGVYFNVLFAVAAGGAYFATHFEPLLGLVVVQHFQIIQQLTPLMRLDGYYVITDLVGVPDILSRLKPLLRSFLPFEAPDRRVTELKPWVRAATSAYIVLFITALAALLVILGLSAPRVLPAAVHSAEFYSHRAANAWHRHALAGAALAEIQVLAVMLPALGLSLGVIRLLRRLAGRARSSVGRRVRPALGMALVAGIGFAWPFLLWGLRAEPHTGAAQASLRHHAQRDASAFSHDGEHGAHRPSTTAPTPHSTAAPAPPATSTAAAQRTSPATAATSSAATTQRDPSLASGSSGTTASAPSTTETTSTAGTATGASPNSASTTTTTRPSSGSTTLTTGTSTTNTTPSTTGTNGTSTTPASSTTTTTP